MNKIKEVNIKNVNGAYEITVDGNGICLTDLTKFIVTADPYGMEVETTRLVSGNWTETVKQLM